MFSIGPPRPPAINLPHDDQRALCSLFVVPASNGWRQSTARQTFEPECVIVLGFAIKGRATINAPDSDQMALCCCLLFRRRTAGGINSATDIRAGVCDCVLVSRSRAERASVRRTMIRRNRVLFGTLQEPIIRKRALQEPIEDKRSRDRTVSTLGARGGLVLQTLKILFWREDLSAPKAPSPVCHKSWIAGAARARVHCGSALMPPNREVSRARPNTGWV